MGGAVSGKNLGKYACKRSWNNKNYFLLEKRSHVNWIVLVNQEAEAPTSEKDNSIRKKLNTIYYQALEERSKYKSLFNPF